MDFFMVTDILNMVTKDFFTVTDILNTVTKDFFMVTEILKMVTKDFIVVPEVPSTLTKYFLPVPEVPKPLTKDLKTILNKFESRLEFVTRLSRNKTFAHQRLHPDQGQSGCVPKSPGNQEQ